MRQSDTQVTADIGIPGHEVTASHLRDVTSEVADGGDGRSVAAPPVCLRC